MWQEKLWREVNGKPFMGILDNVAGRKTFEYATFGRSGVQQSNSKLFGMQPEKAQIYKTIAHFQSVIGVSGSGLITQIDRGAEQYDETPDTDQDPIVAYGYGIAEEWWESGTGSFGSIDQNTYIDGGGTTRTIKGMVHEQPEYEDEWIFSLDTASIGDTDTIWLDITWDDIATVPRTVDRSADTAYTASKNGSSHWRETTPAYDWSNTDLNTDFVLTTS